jgi:glutathione peroxidase
MKQNAQVGRQVLAVLGLAASAGLALACEGRPQEGTKPAEPPAQPAPAATPTEKAPGEKAPTSTAPAQTAKEPNQVLGYTVNSIDGKPVELSKYAGKVVLIVNVASRCGLTPQYETLQKLYAKHEKDGLVVLGFPANNFMGQEPGTNAEIADFCKGKYNVTFPLFAKISVKGEDAHPLFKQLGSIKPPAGGEPDWNFTKYLVNRRGVAVARFSSRVRPDDAAFTAKVQELLAEKAPAGTPASGEKPVEPAPATSPGKPKDDK